MAIKWKNSQRFQPELVIKKIGSSRNIDASGGVSFSDFNVQADVLVLCSMLNFPAAAEDFDTSALVWRGLFGAGENLTSPDFLVAINKEFDRLLASKESIYYLLTSMSIDSSDVPRRVKILDADINFLRTGFRRKFSLARNQLLSEYREQISVAPHGYCNITIKIKSKSADGAISKAFKALDLQRSLWCLMGNVSMQYSFGGAQFKPINAIRLGAAHTLHTEEGDRATNGIWFEPEFKETKVHKFKNMKVVNKNCRWAYKKISQCSYGEKIISALLRYVRALDDSDQNAAFVRLWGAVESLASPVYADYDKVVQRCAAFFVDDKYHRQVLEHLRDYRNKNIHAGEDSDRARLYCFQLQTYARELIWFHIHNAEYFHSLDEANVYNDLLAGRDRLSRQLELLRKAFRWANPKSVS